MGKAQIQAASRALSSLLCPGNATLTPFLTNFQHQALGNVFYSFLACIPPALSALEELNFHKALRGDVIRR